MKKLTRILSAIVCTLSVAAVPVFAASAVSPSECSVCGGAYVLTPNGCSTFDNTDVQNILGQYTGNNDIQNILKCSGSDCNLNNIIAKCSSGDCDLNNIIEKCGILPDNTQCTDCIEESAPAEKEEVKPQPVPAPVPAENTADNTQESTVKSGSYEQQVADLVNKYRAENGLQPLTLNTKLSQVARMKSQDMKDKGYFSHTSPTYGSPFDMMKQFGISYRTAGENIAMGQRTPEAVMQAWMNSDGHRANILNASYTQIGVGYVEDGNYWTQMFIG